MKTKWSAYDESDAIRNKKRGVLLFTLSISFLNDTWNCLKDKEYKVIPADISIYRLGENLQEHNAVWIMMTSKDFFATGFDGKKASKGIVEFDHEKKEIRFSSEESL